MNKSNIRRECEEIMKVGTDHRTVKAVLIEVIFVLCTKVEALEDTIIEHRLEHRM